MNYTIFKGKTTNNFTDYVCKIEFDNGKSICYTNKCHKDYFDELNPLLNALCLADTYTNTLDDVMKFGIEEMLDDIGIEEWQYKMCKNLHDSFTDIFGANYSEIVFGMV